MKPPSRVFIAVVRRFAPARHSKRKEWPRSCHRTGIPRYWKRRQPIGLSGGRGFQTEEKEMAHEMRSATAAGRHRAQLVRRAKMLWSPEPSVRLKPPVRTAKAAPEDLCGREVGWLCAVSGWLGVALWYLQVLAGTRPSEHFLGVLCCLIVTQLGRVLLQRPPLADVKKAQERHFTPQLPLQPQGVLYAGSNGPARKWIVTW
jgi:hypothetical protein